jgi:hypothetical protein
VSELSVLFFGTRCTVFQHDSTQAQKITPRTVFIAGTLRFLTEGMYGHLDQRTRHNVTGSGCGCHEPCRQGLDEQKQKKQKTKRTSWEAVLSRWTQQTTKHIRVGIISRHLGIHSADCLVMRSVISVAAREIGIRGSPECVTAVSEVTWPERRARRRNHAKKATGSGRAAPRSRQRV